jgi:UDP-N-acetylmuramyl pentapeptide synthase
MGQAIQALADLKPTPGRMQMMATPDGAYMVRDDFKASIDPYMAALDTFAEVPSNRHLVVLGEVSEEQGQHVYREIGAKTGAFADRAIFVGTSKNMQTFRAAAKAAGLDKEAIVHVRTAHEATQALRDELQPGDGVLIKGRWQQGLGRVGLALAGRDVKCRAEPCPFKRELCDICPFLEQEFYGLPNS